MPVPLFLSEYSIQVSLSAIVSQWLANLPTLVEYTFKCIGGSYNPDTCVEIIEKSLVVRGA
jgi:hypothetical protein